jgi:hypothetical protein
MKKLVATAFLSALAGGIAWAGDVSGSWALIVKTPGGSGTPLLLLTQAGEFLSGEYRGRFGNAPITGTVKGDDIELQYSVDAQAQPLVVRYTGKVSDRTMSGKIWLGAFGEGTFSATRQ